MLPSRLYKPTENALLYHYCSPETLNAICQYKTVRFGDLFSMNDFMEMHWGYQVWEKAAGEMIDKVGKSFLDDIDNAIRAANIQGLALASCYSTDGDVLSQWRAYANDGAGYAIGFDATLLCQLPIRALQVNYDHNAQISEVKTFIHALHSIESETEEKRSADFYNSCQLLAFDLAGFKNPAFREEQEVRLIHLATFEPSNNSLKLTDPGGTAFGHPVEPRPIQFHMNGSVPVPHLDIDFTDDGTQNPVSELILGPKNDAIPSGVSVFLETMGIPNVRIRRSNASYR